MSKFKPLNTKGKSNQEILEGLISEATEICLKFDEISRRHATEIEEFRKLHPRNTNGQNLECWVKESTFKLLFEHAEPEIFEFEFHELRRSFLETVERGDPFDEGALFESICRRAGISPFVTLIMNAKYGLSLIYQPTTNPKEIPKLDPFLLELVEFEVVALRLFVDAAAYYGIENYIEVFRG